ncbi:hypothetical protein BT69DRAFT_1279915, partial [Atractiella rhizophila]
SLEEHSAVVLIIISYLIKLLSETERLKKAPSNQKLIVVGEGNMGQRNWYQKNWYQASRHASKVVRYISELVPTKLKRQEDVGSEWLELCML